MRHLHLALLVTLLSTGCGPKETCDDGIKNGEESDIDCGGVCGGCDVDSACVEASDCTTGSCEDQVCAAVCGDSTIDGDEACDDGGESATCDDDCTLAECGDGNINDTAGEACDDSGESAACDDDCTVAECGDGVVNPTANEDCDDSGESADCDDDCTVAECGDATLNLSADEDCDDAGESATCNDDCTIAECGDSKVNKTAGEACDDGDILRGDGCGPTCLHDFVNGSFETGDYTGWTLAEDSDDPEAGAWGILEDGVTLTGEETIFDYHDEVEVSTACLGVTGAVTGASPDGVYAAIQLQTDSESHRMWQDIALSSGTTTLRWAQTYNTVEPFAPTSQYSAVHIRNPADDSILETLFITTEGEEPKASPWTDRSANISAYAGQTVRIDMEHQIQDGCMDAQWDNFLLE